MNTFCTFYIMRHGLSASNKNGVISGQTETKLSPEGIEQAETRARELKNVSFAAAFSSDLERANRTAKIVAQEHALAVTALQILRERHYGELEGRRYEDLEKKLQEKFDAYNNMSYQERFSQKWVPGMESDEEVVGRFLTFLRETALAYPGQNVLVVTHGNMMRTLLTHLGFGTAQELPHGSTRNTSYIVLKSDGVEFEIEKTVGIEKTAIKNQRVDVKF